MFTRPRALLIAALKAAFCVWLLVALFWANLEGLREGVSVTGALGNIPDPFAFISLMVLNYLLPILVAIIECYAVIAAWTNRVSAGWWLFIILCPVFGPLTMSFYNVQPKSPVRKLGGFNTFVALVMVVIPFGMVYWYGWTLVQRAFLNHMIEFVASSHNGQKGGVPSHPHPKSKPAEHYQ